MPRWASSRRRAARLNLPAAPASSSSTSCKLICIANIGPRLLANFGDRSGIEPADFRQHRFGQHAAHLDGAGAALFEWSVVEIGVGIGVQNFVRELRGHGGFDGHAANASSGDVFQDYFQAIDVHRFGERVFHGFARERMIGNFDVARNIFLAGQGLRENGCEQIVGTHALNRRRNFFPAHEAQQGERAAGNPAPARGEDRRSQHGLLEQRFDAGGLEEMKDVGERKAVLLAERNVQAIVGGGGLQLEIERTAEAFAQSEAPGFVDAAAEGRVDHELHAAAFVEEALGDDRGLRGHGAQHGAAFDNILRGLFGAGTIDAAFVFQPLYCCCGIRRIAQIWRGQEALGERADMFTNVRDLLREFHGARRSFAAPERNVGRRAFRVFHRYGAGLHAANAPRSISEEENVAAQAFDGEVFINGADHGAFRLGDHGVHRVIGNCAAAGDRGEAAAAASSEAMIHLVAMQVGAVATAAGGDAVG